MRESAKEIIDAAIKSKFGSKSGWAKGLGLKYRSFYLDVFTPNYDKIEMWLESLGLEIQVAPKNRFYLGEDKACKLLRGFAELGNIVSKEFLSENGFPIVIIDSLLQSGALIKDNNSDHRFRVSKDFEFTTDNFL